MDIIFLGTSSGTPTKTRNVTAIAILESKGRDWCLIDCGEATQHQLLHTKLSLNSLSAIFITHVHGDHCYGLPGLLASAAMNGRTKVLTIVAPFGIKQWYEATLTHTALYLPFAVRFEQAEALVAYKIGQFCVTSTKLSHRVASFAYSFTDLKVDARLNIPKLEKENLPKGALWGKLQSGIDVEHDGKVFKVADFIEHTNKPRKVVVAGDNDQPSILRHECSDCDLLIHESTYTEDMANKASEVGHSYAKAVALFAQECSINNLLLTHFSPRYQNNYSERFSLTAIRNEAASVYTGNLHLASDFDRYSVHKDGTMHLVSSLGSNKGRGFKNTGQ